MGDAGLSPQGDDGGRSAAYADRVPGLYAWLRRNPRLVDGALALLLIYPGAGIPKLGIAKMLVIMPFVVAAVLPARRVARTSVVAAMAEA